MEYELLTEIKDIIISFWRIVRWKQRYINYVENENYIQWNYALHPGLCLSYKIPKHVSGLCKASGLKILGVKTFDMKHVFTTGDYYKCGPAGSRYVQDVLQKDLFDKQRKHRIIK